MPDRKTDPDRVPPDPTIRAAAELLRRAGASVETPGGDGPDLLARHAGSTFAAVVRSSPDNRSASLEGLAAAAVLQSRRHARERDASPVALIAVEKLTRQAVATVERFLTQEAPGAGWAMFDATGRWVSKGVTCLAPRGGPTAGRPARPLAAKDPFSDLGQWLAKVLLARDLNAELLRAPRVPMHNARQLALVAGVSAPTAAEWVRVLRGLSFIETVDGELKLVRVREFLRRWRSAVESRPPKRIPARFVLPQHEPNLQIRKALEKYPFHRGSADRATGADDAIEWVGVPRACLVMFDAVLGLGLDYVVGAPVHLAIERADSESLARLGLRAADARDAHVHVIEPRAPESLFRGAVLARVESGLAVPCSDILQCWLDVASHPVRGRELADAIERSVLAPSLGLEPE